MNKFYFVLLILILAVASSEAQSYRYTVKLKYKNSSSFSLSQPSAFLSQKAIQRRLNQNIQIDSSDLPVNQAYLDSIVKIPGVIILNSSKWLNQVLIETTDLSAMSKINAYPFILHSNPIASVIHANPSRENNGIAALPTNSGILSYESKHGEDGLTEDTINYGNNYPQVHIHEGEYLHKLGYRGQGMSIAILDAGFFNYKTNPAFDSVRINNQVLGEYDFVKNETSVNEDHVHGANCFSIMAANRPGIIVGTAPRSNYWLFRTEDAASEKPVEELNWVAATERADSAGADMISSSLGYTNFDDTSFSHTYAQRNGNTSVITIAADLAAKKGMIVMNSAGNSGGANNDTKYIMCPADGDSVMTVGAVNASGLIGGFSSWGPNAAGKVKPNIVSLGWGAVYANSLGNTATGNGTSYSSPNVAGLIACLWQAFSEFSNMEILDAVEKSSDRYNNPDDRYGHGIPNFRIAYGLLDSKRQKRNAILNGKWITAFPVPFRKLFTVSLKPPSTGRASIKIFDITGMILQEKILDVNQGGYYKFNMNPNTARPFGIYYLQYFDGKNKTTLRLISM